MRLGFFGGILAVLIVAALIVAYSSLFTVYQTQQALVVRLGQPVRVVNEPGLNFKAPFIDSVVYLDKRILDLESPSQEVIASDQKRLVVDAFARSPAPILSSQFCSIRLCAACWVKSHSPTSCVISALS
jgi:modulator of FtsH protease HflC